jgi:alkaline phosphatase D
MGAKFRPLTRRRFITTAVSTTAFTLLGGVAKPYLSRAADRPLITHGLQSGDVGPDSGIVWGRTDRPARMQVEIATTDSFRDIRDGAYVDALPESDFTAKLQIKDLPSGQDIFYRIRFQDLASPTIVGEPMVGRFRTAPTDRRSISFLWSGDQAGQAGGSTKRAAACASMTPCCGTGRTSSSIRVTTSMPTWRSRPR